MADENIEVVLSNINDPGNHREDTEEIEQTHCSLLDSRHSSPLPFRLPDVSSRWITHTPASLPVQVSIVRLVKDEPDPEIAALGVSVTPQDAAVDTPERSIDPVAISNQGAQSTENAADFEIKPKVVTKSDDIDELALLSTLKRKASNHPEYPPRFLYRNEAYDGYLEDKRILEPGPAPSANPDGGSLPLFLQSTSDNELRDAGSDLNERIPVRMFSDPEEDSDDDDVPLSLKPEVVQPKGHMTKLGTVRSLSPSQSDQARKIRKVHHAHSIDLPKGHFSTAITSQATRNAKALPSSAAPDTLDGAQFPLNSTLSRSKKHEDHHSSQRKDKQKPRIPWTPGGIGRPPKSSYQKTSDKDRNSSNAQESALSSAFDNVTPLGPQPPTAQASLLLPDSALSNIPSRSPSTPPTRDHLFQLLKEHFDSTSSKLDQLSELHRSQSINQSRLLDISKQMSDLVTEQNRILLQTSETAIKIKELLDEK